MSEGYRIGVQSSHVTVLRDMMEMVAQINKERGWFDQSRGFGDDIALLHSEVSEAFEAYRERGLSPWVTESGKPEGVAAELADILIRMLDTCYRYNIDLYGEFVKKMNYNRTRPYRHGNKRL